MKNFFILRDINCLLLLLRDNDSMKSRVLWSKMCTQSLLSIQKVRVLWLIEYLKKIQSNIALLWIINLSILHLRFCFVKGCENFTRFVSNQSYQLCSCTHSGPILVIPICQFLKVRQFLISETLKSHNFGKIGIQKTNQFFSKKSFKDLDTFLFL